jgi:dienelactone hydrolase
VMSLLVDAIWSSPGWFEKQPFEKDFEGSVRQVVQLRRAADVLMARPDVDPKRVALVGHDFGAMYGVLAGASDPRFKTFVFLAPTATLAEWYLLRDESPKDKAAYVKQMEAIDPVRWIGRIAPASVLLQFAAQDQYVAKERAQLLIDAAQPPKLARFYATNHALGTSDGVNERFRWLSRELGLPATPLIPGSP